jgi:hypothetical protein
MPLGLIQTKITVTKKIYALSASPNYASACRAEEKAVVSVGFSNALAKAVRQGCAAMET